MIYEQKQRNATPLHSHSSPPRSRQSHSRVPPAAALRRQEPKLNNHLAMASRHYTPLLPLLLSCLLHLSTSQTTAPPAAAAAAAIDERQLLLRSKQVWGSPAVLASWDDATGAPHCNWTHVACASGGRVSELRLAGLNLTGPVPDAIGGLGGLAVLDLYNNGINGSFPAFLYNCTGLRLLDLSQNYLGGDLPADIVRLGENMTYLALNANYFTGTIPPALSRLRRLQTLALDNNRFVGGIPEAIGELTSLQYLSFANNWFDVGELPESFKNLTKLTYFWVAQCNLTGDFPSFFSAMPELARLDLSMNAFTGSIPPGIWSMPKLRYLYVYSNNLTGEIVADDASFGAASLEEIDVCKNQLSGSIPVSFGKLVNLTLLNLFYNNFSGDIPVGIGRLPSLKTLKLFSNKLTGALPPELGMHSPALLVVEADDNEISGEIPAGLCTNGPFRSLTASNNRMNGSIPAGLAGCRTLNNLQLENNQLSGEVPAVLWTGTNLTTVLLRNNQLTGHLPETLYRNLTRLSIEKNRFAGRLPSSGAGLRRFIAGNNLFSGEVSTALAAGMPLLQELQLGGNQLSGVIPETIAALPWLTQLNLSSNQLAGEIPAAIGSMKRLTVLDLSSNHLSGDVPSALGGLKPSALNLSSNQLAGEIPGDLANPAYDRSFLANPGLCAAGPASRYLAGVRPCGSRPSSGGISKAVLGALLAIGALLVITITLAFVIVRDAKKRQRLAQHATVWKLTPFQALDFGEAAVLRGLTEENAIGSGGSGRVYRIGFTNRRDGSTGAFVAVKRIRTAGNLGAKLEREFESEVQILGNIRHANIVKLLCCISSADSKLLVYEYMENESLDRWLHGHQSPDEHLAAAGRVPSVRRAPLDWPMRVRIAVGAAQGLCYMHHECSPPIVHRDVKSSNILLDSEFRPKVADFGLARMLVRAGTPDMVSTVAGSFGYMAPECAHTRKVNEKVDVYSFGVVLLELTTGREANDGGEHGCLAEWAWRHLQSGKSIAEATDKVIRDAGYLRDIEVMFKLGIICTGSLPSTRPTMKDVLQILLRCDQSQQKSKEEKHAEYEAAPLLHMRGIDDDKGFDCNV